MKLIGLNHISLVVRDLAESSRFYRDVMNLVPVDGVDGWFFLVPGHLNLHLIEIDEAVAPEANDMHHYYRHNAMEVGSINDIARAALAAGFEVFQMDENGEEEAVTDWSADLSFGLCTVFTRDPDGNLWEFLERGKSWEKLWSGLADGDQARRAREAAWSAAWANRGED